MCVEETRVLFNNIGYVNNLDMCLKVMSSLCPELKFSSPDEILDGLNQKYATEGDFPKCRFFDNTYKEYMGYTSSVKFKWVDTGYRSKNGEPIYFQYVLQDTFVYSGCRVGLAGDIIRSTVDYFTEQAVRRGNKVPKYKVQFLGMYSNRKYEPVEIKRTVGTSLKSYIDKLKITPVAEPSTEVEEQKSEVNDSEVIFNQLSPLATNLYPKILNKEIWVSDKAGYLETYIDTLVSRLNWVNKDSWNSPSFVLLNKDGTCGLYNTGLLDIFGKDIYLVSNLEKDGLQCTGFHIVIGKRGLTCKTLNFDADSFDSIPCVSFYDSISDLIFDAELKDFDLTNNTGVEHCLLDRLDRFPKEFRSLSSVMLYSDMVRAVELGITLSKRDRNYVKPFYNPQQNVLSFIIPYHIFGDMSKKPDLGIVVRKIGEYWQIMTVLDSDMVLRSTLPLSVYTNITFRRDL